jgi:uncharacterized protein (TIGR03437 family)
LSSGALLANQIDVNVSLAPPIGSTPVIAPGAVLNSASFSPGEVLAPGSLVSIFGSQLADGEARSGDTPLDTNLANTEVRLNDRPMPLLYVSSGQINAQIPYDVPSNTPLQLLVRKIDAQSYPETVTVAPAAPGIFTDPSTGRAIVINRDGSVNSPSSPAHAGEVVVMYGTGLGPVNPPVADGYAAPAAAPTVNPVVVQIGGISVTPLYAGLTPGSPGLYQINVAVPQNVTPSSQVPVVMTIANQSSPAVTVSVE